MNYCFYLTVLLFLAVSGCFTSGITDNENINFDDNNVKCIDFAQKNKMQLDKSLYPSSGGEIAIQLESEPGILLSLVSSHSAISNIIDHNVMEALVSINPETSLPVGELSNKWNVIQNENGKVSYTFSLVKNARWHDGNGVTAKDVAFTFGKLLDPAGGAVLRNEFLDIDEVKVINDFTVAFVLDKMRPGFVFSLSKISILPEHVFKNDTLQQHPAARAPLGSGPFKFKRWEPGRFIELVKNTDWRGTPALVEKIVYKVVASKRIALDLFRGGKLDIVTGVHASDIIDGGKLFTYPLSSFEGWLYNTQFKVLSESAVRRAIGSLIDRQAIRGSILGCMAEIVNSPWPFTFNSTDSSAKKNRTTDLTPAITKQVSKKFSTHKARSLLDSAGWIDKNGDGIRDKNGIKLSFSLLLSDLDKNNIRAVTVVQHDLAKVGIKMKTSIVSGNVYINRLQNHNFEAAIIQVSNRHPFKPSQIFHSKSIENGSNFGLFKDEQTDFLIEKLEREPDKEKHIELKRKISSRLNIMQPLTFTFRPLKGLLIRNSISGIDIRNDWINERLICIQKDKKYRKANIH